MAHQQIPMLASLIHYTLSSCEKYIIDPNAEHVENIKVIREMTKTLKERMLYLEFQKDESE